MKKIGLALSGGGFRASLYHLGLARFLRDAGILSQVTHITSVSGGSVIAVHLVLNWDRYNGDVVLPAPWRLLGPIEAAVGILMFGWSTGIMVAAITRIYGSRFGLLHE